MFYLRKFTNLVRKRGLIEVINVRIGYPEFETLGIKKMRKD